jgi:hypothetical protein
MFWFTSLFLSLWSQASSHYVRTVVYTQHLYLELVHDSTRPIRARARVVPLPLTRGAQSHSHTAHTQDSPAPTHLLLLLSTLCVSAPALPSAPSAPLAGPTSAPLCLRPRRQAWQALPLPLCACARARVEHVSPSRIPLTVTPGVESNTQIRSHGASLPVSAQWPAGACMCSPQRARAFLPPPWTGDAERGGSEIAPRGGGVVARAEAAVASGAAGC